MIVWTLLLGYFLLAIQILLQTHTYKYNKYTKITEALYVAKKIVPQNSLSPFF